MRTEIVIERVYNCFGAWMATSVAEYDVDTGECLRYREFDAIFSRSLSLQRAYCCKKRWSKYKV